MDKKEKLYERALATCVVMLIVCVILKLFGVQWFNLDTGIPLLNAIDRVVMESFWLTTLYSLIFMTINTCLTISIAIRKMLKLKEIIIVAISSMILITLKHYVLSNSIIDIFYLIMLVFLIERKSSKHLAIQTIVVSFVSILYQALSLYIRDIPVNSGNYGMTLSTLMMIDYYLMLIITYLYVRRCDRWTFHAYFSSLASQLWKKHSQNSKQCFDKEI